MRFLQIVTFYQNYLSLLYSKFKYLHQATYQDQIDVLISDAFAAVHILSPYMQQVGYESYLVIANCHHAQIRWLIENNKQCSNPNNWIEEITLKQIEEFEPDILYISDPILFNGTFIRKISHRPKLVLGWRAAAFPYDIDWSGFDVMLSSLKPLLDLAVQHGAQYGEVFMPGFPPNIVERIRDIEPSKDIVFIGQYNTSQHTKRDYYLRQIANASIKRGYDCQFHISGNKDNIPPIIKKYAAEPVYGLSMYKSLRNGRIAFDARADHFIINLDDNSKIDIGGEYTANMRIFESTGSGVFLLTEYFSNINQYFEPGKEIETFKDRKELIEKIDYYIANPKKDPK